MKFYWGVLWSLVLVIIVNILTVNGENVNDDETAEICLSKSDVSQIVKKLTEGVKRRKGSSSHEVSNHSQLVGRFALSLSKSIEDFSLISIDEWRSQMKMTMVAYDPHQGVLKNIYGNKTCDLIKMPSEDKNEPAPHSPVCPWHYELRVRDNIYPHMRVNAICNCQKCLAKTEFDAKFNFSRCRQVFTYMPVLIRETAKSAKGPNTVWRFGMEQVATSCVCSLTKENF